MRHLFSVMFLLFLTLGGSAAALAVRPAIGAEQPVLRQVVITVKGMMCASCGKEIEKSLKQTAGVAAVTVDTAKDRATVTYDERKVSPSHLSEVIRKAGYEALLPVDTHPAPPSGR